MPSPPWLAALAVYRDWRILAIVLLGFSSGLPLALTGSTMGVWLTESGVSKTSVGLFTLVTVPYTLKYLWAPLVDRLPLPWLTRRFGRRRGWALLAQGAVMVAIVAMGTSAPQTDPWWTALFALLVAFASASQDIVIDAWRVEILDPPQYGAGAATVVLGYRLGMLSSGAGALYLAESLPWSQVYGLMALLVLVGMLTILAVREPDMDADSRVKEDAAGRALLARMPAVAQRTRPLLLWLYGAVVAPFAQFMTRPAWAGLLLFIAVYKLGDAMAGIMAAPFYLELGFSKSDIAGVTKVFGLVATLAGGLMGGAVVARFGVWRALLVCGIAQMLSNLMYVLLAIVGHSLPILMLTIAVENMTGGMATAAFVAFLSSLCAVAYTATQYALLSSCAGISRDLLGASAGWFADHMVWPGYFLLTTAAAWPGLGLLVWLWHRERARRPPESELRLS